MPRGKKAQSTKRAPEEEPEKSTNENSNTQEQNDEETLKKRKTLHAPTVHAIVTDSLTHLSLQHWASADKSKSFDLSVVDSIYTKELLGHNFDIQRIMLLEVSHYLENYLWKHYDPKTATHAHMMSILVMVNEKFRENVSAWDAFHTKEEVFPTFFEKVLDMFYSKTMTLQEKTIYLVFLINLYQSLEDPMVRKECLSLVSLPLWTNLNEQRLAKELKLAPKINKLWDNFKSKDKDSKDKKKTFEKKFIVDLIQDFVSILDSISDPAPSDKVKYCERFVEFLLDLISQLPTRRLFHPVFQSQLLVQRCIKSHLSTLKEGKLFNHLVEMLKFYDGFEINNYTGSPISEEESMEIQSGKVHTLQKIAFQNFQELKDLALSNSATVESRDKLVKYLSGLTDARLYDLGHKLGLLGDKDTYPRDLVLETILSYHERRLSHIESINETSIFPTEDLLWDPDLIPTDEYNGDHCLALPKLNLQFLTFHDYLLRNYDLFRLEACYEIKLDLEDSIKRVNARKDAYSNKIKYVGWSRMALPVQEFSVKNVRKPKLGEEKPSEVNAEVKISLEKVRNQNTRNEWDSIKVHDVLFLVTLRPKLSEKQEIDTSLPFLDQYGVEFVRGCEVKELLDEKGKPIRDYESEESPRNGDVRTIKISLDPSQYHFDMTSKDEDVYGSFNLLIRRKAKENNFKAVLETIRDLMNTKTSVPEWLHDLFLGYGDPSSLKKIEKPLTVNFNDTFLSADHVTASFPGKKIIYKNLEGKEVDKKSLLPPFRVTFPPTSSEDALVVQPYTIPRPGPFPFNQPKKNQVEFTPSQVEGIRSGIKEGLTLIVGPPGTGKTDTAVQIINNWYHNYPEQRTLIVTHSNQALNQLFEKIVKLDIDERHFVRLGHGEEQLSVEKDFSKYGRVNYMLGRRIELLAQVEILTRSVNERPDFAYTCETSAQFYQSIVIPTINTFLAKVNESQTAENVVEAFPYHKFFSHVPQPLFPPSNTYLQNMEIAETCLRFIHNMFKELDECRPFELLRSPYDRANYLVTHHAKIIAMTCTHAALKRAELVAQGFHYDNMLMEESAQVLEIETFIPMLLQENPKRLKRVVLIGDHNQLPPVVKNLSFQKYAHLDQSLFTRFVRLGMPYVELDAQGRARPQIAELYNWRYKKLSDLPVVKSEEYQLGNAGLRHDFQMINVEDFDGHGETQPIPYFYQNLGEAEHCVALYMYMRLLGYPKEKITILTTYNGQKALIKDVIDARCGQNPLFGKPKITTVDRFQGQQNDYILLSLVRTSAVGHLRDVRRLVVAMSRARLGLYVFCRAKLFENCYELTQSFSKLRTRPTVLQIVENEEYPTKRKVNAEVKAVDITSLEQLGNLMTKVAPRAQERYEKEQAEKARILAEKQQEEMKKREEEMRKYNERMAAYNKQVAASQTKQRKPKQKAEEEEEVESEEEEDEPNNKMQE